MAGVGRGARRMAFTLRGGADEQKRLQGGAHWQYTEYNNAIDTSNWLRVLGTAELAQIDQGVCQQFHAIVPLLDTFKAEQQSLELIFPRKGALHAHPQRMDGFIEEAFASALRGLPVAGILLDIGDEARIENALAIVRRIKAAIKIEIRPSEIQPDLFGHLF